MAKALPKIMSIKLQRHISQLTLNRKFQLLQQWYSKTMIKERRNPIIKKLCLMKLQENSILMVVLLLKNKKSNLNLQQMKKVLEQIKLEIYQLIKITIKLDLISTVISL
jgi:hypothetical protein